MQAAQHHQKFAHLEFHLRTGCRKHDQPKIPSIEKKDMPTFRRPSVNDNDPALQQARAAARQRRDLYIEIRGHLATLYPQYPNLLVRSQQSAGAGGHPSYVGLVLYETTQSSRLTPANPVIGADAQYYDDRLVGNISQFTVLLQGTPGMDQTDAMMRLLERVEVLVRSGWRSTG